MPKSTERLRYIKIIKLLDTNAWSPPAFTEARVLGGYINHIAATADSLVVQSLDGNTVHFSISNVLSTNCTTSFVVNPITVPTTYDLKLTADSKEIWFDSSQRLYFDGAATATAILIIEVVKIDEYTGERLA